jgi:hypothetical protein
VGESQHFGDEEADRSKGQTDQGRDTENDPEMHTSVYPMLRIALRL